MHQLTNKPVAKDAEDLPIAHTGLHTRRFSRLDHNSAHREAAFAVFWEQAQESHLLEYLMGNLNTRAQISQRDALVAATVVQWLGSPVGQDFINKAMANASASIQEAEKI